MRFLILFLTFLGVVKPVYAMPRTIDDDPLQKFMYRVSIPGYPPGMGFSTIGNFVREMGVVEYAEGMFEYFHKLSGRQKVTDIVFERGAYRDEYMFTIYNDTLTDPKHRTTVTIEVMDRYQQPCRDYVLAEAWGSKIEQNGLDASSDEILIDQLTITFEYFLGDKSTVQHRNGYVPTRL